MKQTDRDDYYFGTGKHRDWDRSSRDGDYGRDYENRFRTDRDRNDEYRNRDYTMERDYYKNMQNSTNDMSNIRQGYGVPSFSSDSYQQTSDDIARRMQRDRDRLRKLSNSGNQDSGYSGSRFGGSNYSAHGDFGGSSEYSAMSGDRGNVDDYTSMSGYGGGYGSTQHSSGRGESNYSNRSNYDRYSNRGSGSGMARGVGRYSPDNYSESTGNQGSYGSREYNPYNQDRNYNMDRNDRGGYRNHDPNDRRDYEITQ